MNERTVINAVVALLSNLFDCDVKTLPEAHLSANYIHPFMHGPLSCKMSATIAHCSNILPDKRPGSDNCPDYKVDIYTPSYKYNYTNMYGEIKPTANMSPTLIVNDFYRTAILAKDALNIFHLRQSLAFQAIGKTITFFVMSLSHPQLHTFTELASIQIPTKKSDLLNFIGHFNNLAFISSVHKNDCVPLETNLDDLRCDTLSIAYVKSCQAKLTSKKRPFALTID